VATTIAIPRMSQAVTEATITAWLVEDGARVAAGEVLYRLETEKVEMDVEAPVSGVVTITGTVGETYPVGTAIGQIDDA
jgi:2-oxoglutarate dehydrogenase E2 component (dihydrolipoamide succinyltransferase)